MKYHESCLYKSRYPGDTKTKLHSRRCFASGRKTMRIKIRIPNPEDVKAGAKRGTLVKKRAAKEYCQRHNYLSQGVCDLC